MLLFSTEYDDETKLCARLAIALTNRFSSTLLQGSNAIRSNLLTELKSGKHDVVAFFSHGSQISISESETQDALTYRDLQSIKPAHQAFAYTCHSGHLGLDASANSWTWWGYDNLMQPPPYHSVRPQQIEDIFHVILSTLPTTVGQAQVLIAINHIKLTCDSALNLHLKANSNRASYSDTVFFRHIWSRLRVWLPGGLQPLKHPEAYPGPLDWDLPA